MSSGNVVVVVVVVVVRLLLKLSGRSHGRASTRLTNSAFPQPYMDKSRSAFVIESVEFVSPMRSTRDAGDGVPSSGVHRQFIVVVFASSEDCCCCCCCFGASPPPPPAMSVADVVSFEEDDDAVIVVVVVSPTPAISVSAAQHAERLPLALTADAEHAVAALYSGRSHGSFSNHSNTSPLPSDASSATKDASIR